MLQQQQRQQEQPERESIRDGNEYHSPMLIPPTFTTIPTATTTTTATAATATATATTAAAAAAAATATRPQVYQDPQRSEPVICSFCGNRGPETLHRGTIALVSHLLT